MNILVCVKQVPDSETSFEIDDSKKWIKEKDNIVYRMNRFDEYAVEEAVRIKESFEDVYIDVISVGPERVEAAIRRAMGMGADRGIHILNNDNGYNSPSETAALIASYAKEKEYNLIFTGVMAEDDMQCQVGQLIAGILDIPFASSCMYERLSPGNKSINVYRELEGGLKESVDLELPALLTIQSGINHPRYPSLSNVLRAKKQELDVIQPESLQDNKKNETLINIFYPEKSGRGTIIEGTPDEKARKLYNILHEKALI